MNARYNGDNYIHKTYNNVCYYLKVIEKYKKFKNHSLNNIS